MYLQLYLWQQSCVALVVVVVVVPYLSVGSSRFCFSSIHIVIVKSLPSKLHSIVIVIMITIMILIVAISLLDMISVIVVTMTIVYSVIMIW